jgi:hypothetical protein
MNTHSSQIQLKISLSEQLNDLLESKAARFGVPVTQFVKHLILKEVENQDYPTFAMSARTEEKAHKALKEYEEGKAVIVDDLDTFFEEL